MRLLKRKFNFAIILFITLLFAFAPNHLMAKELPIYPVYQQTVVWCWAAASEMVLRYYKYPSINPIGDYQCGIVATFSQACSPCYNCMTTIGSSTNLATVLSNYPSFVRIATGQNVSDIDTYIIGRLSAQDIKNMIDSGHPIIAGISTSGFGEFYPPGMSEHAVVIVGYHGNVDNMTIIINDPMPYAFVGAIDPYIKSGGKMNERAQYEIKYNNFINELDYKDSITFSSTNDNGGDNYNSEDGGGSSCFITSLND